eukprot:5082553-Pyramimonas_sp.AAC.1
MTLDVLQREERSLKVDLEQAGLDYLPPPGLGKALEKLGGWTGSGGLGAKPPRSALSAPTPRTSQASSGFRSTSRRTG